MLRAPESMIDARSHEVELLVARGRDRIERRLDAQARRTAELRATLRALSPASTLARGYAIAHLAGRRDRPRCRPGTGTADVVVTVGRGSFAARSEGEVPIRRGAGRHAPQGTRGPN